MFQVSTIHVTAARWVCDFHVTIEKAFSNAGYVPECKESPRFQRGPDCFDCQGEDDTIAEQTPARVEAAQQALGLILIVEDDDRLRSALRLALRDEGFAVEAVPDAESALDRLGVIAPDLILVDIMLPGANGLDLCRSIRRSSHVPIIIVTARDDSHDVVAGLESGADDYVTKPFVIKELAARMRALLRRTRFADEGSASMHFGDLIISPEEGRVTNRGQGVQLTRIEFLLLCELAQNLGRVMSRDVLLENVWGYDYFGDGRVVDAHIRRLRKKIESDPSNPRYVVTVRGLGYRFEPPSDGNPD